MVRRSTLLAAALAAIVGVAAPAAHAASAPFKLDIHFSKTPAKLSNQAAPSFSLQRNVHFGVKAQTCRIGTAAWKACGIVWNPGHLADGQHTAQVKLVMNDGRTAGSSYTWTIDATAPAAPVLTGTSASWVSAASRQVTIHSTDHVPSSGIASYSYRLNGGVAHTTTSGQVTVSGQGVTTIVVTALDKAGNRSLAATGSVV